MTASQPNLLELAKQGDARAIATLMNRSLQPKGMAAKVAFKDGCLQVMVEASQVPDEKAMVTFVQKGIISLEAKSIKNIKVFGKQTEKPVAWTRNIELVQNPFESSQIGSETQQEKTIVVKDVSSDKVAKGIVIAVIFLSTVWYLGAGILDIFTPSSLGRQFEGYAQEAEDALKSIANTSITALASSCKYDINLDNQQRTCEKISENTMRERYPFTVEEGMLVCTPSGELIFNDSQTKNYAVNKAAKAKGYYLNIEEIQRDKPIFSWFPFLTQKASLDSVLKTNSTSCKTAS
jgi:hypothetical protein